MQRVAVLGATGSIGASTLDVIARHPQAMRASVLAAGSKVDALLAPTSPSVAFPIGAKTDDPLLMYLNDACTLPVNIAGLPGISVPCGLSDGKPVGLQVIGRAFDEAMILRVADAYERAAGFAELRSPLAHA